VRLVYVKIFDMENLTISPASHDWQGLQNNGSFRPHRTIGVRLELKVQCPAKAATDTTVAWELLRGTPLACLFVAAGGIAFEVSNSRDWYVDCAHAVVPSPPHETGARSWTAGISLKLEVPPTSLERAAAMKRYLVLIHLAAKFEKLELVERSTALLQAMKFNLDDMAPVLTAEKGFAFVGTSNEADASALWKKIVVSTKLARQDNISVIELGRDIVTTHPGLSQWQSETRFLAGLIATSGKK
jgi:hypothetical protein